MSKESCTKDGQLVTQFRGWTLPGPRVPGGGLGLGPEQTLDALSGHFKIYQNKKGHRFSTDDLVTAWYATAAAPTPTRVLDLGSGLGTVAMILAWKWAGAKLTTIEAQEESFAMALKSVAYNGLTSRFEMHLGDLRSTESLLGEKGKAAFDLVSGTPPYFAKGEGIEGDTDQKVRCRFETRGGIEEYALAAAFALAPGGVFAFVLPALQSARAFAACAAAGLRVFRWRPVVAKEGEAPLLGVFAAVRVGDLPEAGPLGATFVEERALVIRKKNGEVDSEYALAKLSIGFPP